MKVLVDTSVWSVALRRRDPDPSIAKHLTDLISEFRLIVIGPIRQELLSGIKTAKQFHALKQRLAAFPDHPITQADYETAASFYNSCRKKGIQGSHIDFLICAVAANNGFAILTTDPDFAHYKKYIRITLAQLP